MSTAQETTSTVDERTPLEIVAFFREWGRSSHPGFKLSKSIGYGATLGRAPSTPEGLAALRKLRQAAEDAARTPLQDTGELGAAIHSALSSMGLSNIVPLGLSEYGEGLSYSLPITHTLSTLRGLPSGPDAPTPLVRADMEGLRIDEPMKVIRSMEACSEGSIAFLSRFDIGFDRESSECAECGAYHEGEDGYGDGDLADVEPFTLTAPMLSAIEDAGFLEALEEALDAEPIEWAEYVSDRELPGVSGGIEVDGAWIFEPDFGAILADESVETVCALIPKLMRLCKAYAAEGKAPPIPGVYSRVGIMGTEIKAYWDGVGSCSTIAESTRAARIERAKNGDFSIVLPDGMRRPVDAEGRLTVPYGAIEDHERVTLSEWADFKVSLD